MTIIHRANKSIYTYCKTKSDVTPMYTYTETCPSVFAPFSSHPTPSLVLLFYLHNGGEQAAVNARNLLVRNNGLDSMEEAIVLVGTAELQR